MYISKTVGLLMVVSMIMFGFSTIAVADDVVDYINEALKYYKDGQYTEAVSSLSSAEQMIQQKKSSGLEAFLPKPLTGWEADAASSLAVGAAMMGGGISAEREYHKGDSRIHIQIMADSPMLQSVMMMITNPMFAASDGGKMERIGKQQAIVKFNAVDNSGEIQLVAANRFMVTIEGDRVSLGDLRKYARAINYDKLATLP